MFLRRKPRTRDLQNTSNEHTQLNTDAAVDQRLREIQTAMKRLNEEYRELCNRRQSVARKLVNRENFDMLYDRYADLTR